MNNIKICAFLGSPRSRGNTEILLNEALKSIKENGLPIKLFNLNKMNIRGCQDCGDCEDSGICSQKDGMEQIYEAIRSCNRFILASPVFFLGLSAQTKAMIDRGQAFWCEKYLLKKPLPQKPVERKGLLLIVGGMKREIGYTCSEATAKAFFRTINVNKHKTLAFSGIDEKGAILKYKQALKQAYEAGEILSSK